MSQTALPPEQAAAIREAARAKYRELFGPLSPEQLQVIGEVIGPVWRRIVSEGRAPKRETAPAPSSEAA